MPLQFLMASLVPASLKQASLAAQVKLAGPPPPPQKGTPGLAHVGRVVGIPDGGDSAGVNQVCRYTPTASRRIGKRRPPARTVQDA